MTAIDDALDEVVKIMKDEAVKKKKMSPYLNKQLKKIQKIDNKIEWFELKKAELEGEKQKELTEMGELMDLAVVAYHSLYNGYTVIPDNKRNMKIIDSGAFLKWLKTNRPPSEVFKFLKDALKIANLKSFCNAEINAQRLKGIMEPKIDGIDIGGISYRRYKTKVKNRVIVNYLDFEEYVK